MANIIMQDVPSGGGISIEELVSCAEPSGEITVNADIASYGLSGRNAVTRVNVADGKSIGEGGISRCSELLTIFAPKASVIGASALAFNTKLQTVVIGECGNFTTICRGNTVMTTADINSTKLYTGFFQGSPAVGTLILRSTAITALQTASALSDTKFKSGGAGGTIYIPKLLYDHLGDGTANDYKAATNWSIIDGYGTITWAQIEGSIYENAYADGTPIS